MQGASQAVNHRSNCTARQAGAPSPSCGSSRPISSFSKVLLPAPAAGQQRHQTGAAAGVGVQSGSTSPCPPSRRATCSGCGSSGRPAHAQASAGRPPSLPQCPASHTHIHARTVGSDDGHALPPLNNQVGILEQGAPVVAMGQPLDAHSSHAHLLHRRKGEGTAGGAGGGPGQGGRRGNRSEQDSSCSQALGCWQQPAGLCCPSTTLLAPQTPQAGNTPLTASWAQTASPHRCRQP